MKMDEVQRLHHGLYRIYWKKSIKPSLAAVGSSKSGSRWLAPINWVTLRTELTFRDWAKVERVVLIQEGNWL